MDSLRRIELGGLVALLTAIVGLAVFFSRLDTEVKNLKKQVESLKPEKIREEQDKALKDFKEETEKVMEEAREKTASLGSIENVRTIVTKSDADKFCSSESGVSGALAAHVPFSYLGKTGQDICAANHKDLKRCAQVPFVWVSNENRHSTYKPENKGCSEPVEYAWPWGRSFGSPNTLGIEWGHGNTWVVCCYKL